MKRVKYLVAIFMCLLLVGCGGGKKEVGTVDSFESAAVENKFMFLDNLGSYPDVDYIKEAKKAILDSTVVEMIVYKDEKNAKKVQEEQIENFRTIKNTATTEHKDDGGNYYKFWMVSNGYYMVSSRIDNTLVFCKTQLENKEKVEAILKKMNY